jgi:hypothetical protein
MSELYTTDGTSPETEHRSQMAERFGVHRSPFPVHGSPFTVRSAVRLTFVSILLGLYRRAVTPSRRYVVKST